jgi:hypothetical protein
MIVCVLGRRGANPLWYLGYRQAHLSLGLGEIGSASLAIITNKVYLSEKPHSYS